MKNSKLVTFLKLSSLNSMLFIYSLERSSYFFRSWTDHLLSGLLPTTFFVIKDTIMLLWQPMQLTENIT